MAGWCDQHQRHTRGYIPAARIPKRGVSDESLIEHLASAGINLISTVPPPPGLRDQWIATIGGDISSALKAIWPDLIADQGGASLPALLTVTHINPDLFSPGRQRLVDNLIVELSSGFIDTGVEQAGIFLLKMDR
jgi:hypothetical protein